MSKIRSYDTSIERALGKAMFAQGLRYRKQYSVTGRPDFAFLGPKVAIFCDSSFWHGRNWNEAKEKIHTNREFWWSKIEVNIRRDQQVNEILANDGWMVIRFWDYEITSDVQSCAQKVQEIVKMRARKKSDKTSRYLG